MRQKKGRKNNTFSKVEKLLEIPQEISSDIPKFTMLGFEKLLIENYKAVLEYQDFFIRISTYIGIININGFELDLQEMRTDELLITGKIESIDIEAISDEA